MPQFVIAGRPDCRNFAHAVHVATYLEGHLPDFKLKVVRRKAKAWQVFKNYI